MLPPGVAAQIEHICRGVYLLPMVNSDEMFREGRQEEGDRIGKDASGSQDSIQ